MGFLGGPVVKNLPANAVDSRDACSIPGLFGKIPWSRKWDPTPVFLPGKLHGQRSMAAYSSWGHKELGMTAHTYRHTHTYTNTQHTYRYIKQMLYGIFNRIYIFSIFFLEFMAILIVQLEKNPPAIQENQV